MCLNFKKGIAIRSALFFLMLLFFKQANAIQDFKEAKYHARLLWQKNRQTFYCGCRYSKHGVIDYDSCRFQPKDKRHARYIQWEHIVPVSWYGKKRNCWKKQACFSGSERMSGRQCCRLIDKAFNKMEADLHNLVPAIPEINEMRSNYHFAELGKAARAAHQIQGCALIIDEKKRLVEPLGEIKGRIARAHLYMSETYEIKLSDSERALMMRWNKQHPPSGWEKEWNKAVAEVQGQVNRYITYFPGS